VGLTFEREITQRPFEDGFLNIPAKHRGEFPGGKGSTRIRVFLDSATEAVEKNFQMKDKRITGLGKWYTKNEAQVGDRVSIEVIKKGEYRMKLIHSKVRMDAGGSLGKQWFESFRKELYSKWQDPRWGSDYGNDAWTKTMIPFLLDLGNKYGYRPIQEKGRRDVSWYRGETLEVHIEHENDGDNWDTLVSHEISDLRSSSAKLKVLITYVHPDSYPAKEYAEKLVGLLNSEEPKNSEWLLVIAPWYPEEAADYIAYYLRPSFSQEMLVIPSGLGTKE
jgi:hypothetical protein